MGFRIEEEVKKEPFSLPFLPPLLDDNGWVVRGGNVVSGSWFDLTLQFLEQEAQTGRIGTTAIVKRLAEIIIYAWLEQERQKNDLLPALADRRLGHSLNKAIHRDPTQRWTVGALANEAGMSRTTFAEPF